MQSPPPPQDCRNPNPNPNPVPHIPSSANAPPPAPPRGNHHRRTRSELPLRTSGDLSDNLRQFDEIGPDDDFFCTYMDMEKLGGPRPGPGPEPGPCWDLAGESSAGSAAKHRHSSSADGSSMPSWVKGEGVFEEGLEIKKAMTSKQLSELAAIDPKRAKRILANRQSAAHSKERKARYISVLERNVQTLQTEATTLSAQLTLYQRDTTGLSAENADLNLQLQIMEQQAQLHDALNETLKQEVQRLKIATGEISNTSETYNMGLQHIAYNLSFPLPN